MVPDGLGSRYFLLKGVSFHDVRMSMKSLKHYAKIKMIFMK